MVVLGGAMAWEVAGDKGREEQAEGGELEVEECTGKGERWDEGIEGGGGEIEGFLLGKFLKKF